MWRAGWFVFCWFFFFLCSLAEILKLDPASILTSVLRAPLYFIMFSDLPLSRHVMSIADAQQLLSVAASVQKMSKNVLRSHSGS